MYPVRTLCDTPALAPKNHFRSVMRLHASVHASCSNQGWWKNSVCRVPAATPPQASSTGAAHSLHAKGGLREVVRQQPAARRRPVRGRRPQGHGNAGGQHVHGKAEVSVTGTWKNPAATTARANTGARTARRKGGAESSQRSTAETLAGKVLSSRHLTRVPRASASRAGVPSCCYYCRCGQSSARR